MADLSQFDQTGTTGQASGGGQAQQLADAMGNKGILSKGRDELVKTIKGGAKKEKPEEGLLAFVGPPKGNQISEKLEEREKDKANKRKHEKKS